MFTDQAADKIENQGVQLQTVGTAKLQQQIGITQGAQNRTLLIWRCLWVVIGEIMFNTWLSANAGNSREACARLSTTSQYLCIWKTRLFGFAMACLSLAVAVSIPPVCQITDVVEK